MKKLRDEDQAPIDCRWQKAPGCRYELGRFKGRDAQGNVELTAERNGASRTLLASKVEFRSTGPKGGEVWTSAEEVERPIQPE